MVINVYSLYTLLYIYICNYSCMRNLHLLNKKHDIQQHNAKRQQENGITQPTQNEHSSNNNGGELTQGDLRHLVKPWTLPFRNISVGTFWLGQFAPLQSPSLQSGVPNSKILDCFINWLVVSTPLKNTNQWEGLSHILWKIKHVWNHQPVNQFESTWLFYWHHQKSYLTLP